MCYVSLNLVNCCTATFPRYHHIYSVRGVAVWHTGNALVSISEVDLRGAWLLVVSTGIGDRVQYVTSHPGQLSLLPFVGQ